MLLFASLGSWLGGKVMNEERVSNEFLLEEVRLNRNEIQCLGDRVGGKVGRGELYGVLGTLGTIFAAAVALLAGA